MTKTSNVQITIALQDPNLDEEELQTETQRLLQQLLELDEIEAANLVQETNIPTKSKSLTALVIGWLQAQVNPKNFQELMKFLAGNLVNKTIEMEVEANGKKLKVKASNSQELAAAIQAAQKFVENQGLTYG